MLTDRLEVVRAALPAAWPEYHNSAMEGRCVVV